MTTQTQSDLVSRLRAAWPTLPATERQLILDLVWATSGEDSPLADVLDDLEATLAYDASHLAGGTLIRWEDLTAELGTSQPLTNRQTMRRNQN